MKDIASSFLSKDGARIDSELTGPKMSIESEFQIEFCQIGSEKKFYCPEIIGGVLGSMYYKIIQHLIGRKDRCSAGGYSEIKHYDLMLPVT